MKAPTDNRLLLQKLLKGKITLDQVWKELEKNQPPKRDLSLLTKSESALFETLNAGYQEAKALLPPDTPNYVCLAHLSINELRFLRLCLKKAEPDYEKRHILDRVDLTAVSEGEMDQACTVLLQPWAKVFEDQLPEWLKGARA